MPVLGVYTVHVQYCHDGALMVQSLNFKLLSAADENTSLLSFGTSQEVSTVDRHQSHGGCAVTDYQCVGKSWHI